MSRWALRAAGGAPERVVTTSRLAPPSLVIDTATKREVQWLVSGTRGRPAREPTGPAAPVQELDLLLRGAPCPVLTVQPWVGAAGSPSRVAVVGVDRSGEAQAAAFAAARLLAKLGSPARLVLAHGTGVHPTELAAHTPWSTLSERMRPDSHPWIRTLAQELRSPRLLVDIVIRLAWAPDLIGGLAQETDADFTALGVRRGAESFRTPLGRLQRRVIQTTPCPLLTTTTATPAGERRAT